VSEGAPVIKPGFLVGNHLACCGDCEHYPCQCADEVDFADAWLQQSRYAVEGGDTPAATRFDDLFRRTA
jgi:hypothetical protein